MPTSPASLSTPLRAGLAAALLALCAALPVAAAPAPQQDAPTLIDSEKLDYDDARQTSVFTGNVVLTRGDLTLRAHRLELRQNEAGDQFAVATAADGKQVFVRQAAAKGVESVEGHADRAEYNSSTQQLDFIGHAVVNRMACGKVLDEIRGERIRYNQGTDVYSASGGPQAGTTNQRVRTVIQSRQASQAVIDSCAPGGKAQ